MIFHDFSQKFLTFSRFAKNDEINQMQLTTQSIKHEALTKLIANDEKYLQRVFDFGASVAVINIADVSFFIQFLRFLHFI